MGDLEAIRALSMIANVSAVRPDDKRAKAEAVLTFLVESSHQADAPSVQMANPTHPLGSSPRIPCRSPWR